MPTLAEMRAHPGVDTVPDIRHDTPAEPVQRAAAALGVSVGEYVEHAAADRDPVGRPLLVAALRGPYDDYMREQGSPLRARRTPLPSRSDWTP
ncbi:MAG: hypothetical protein EKK55_24475 [Rhodocyclaceae bacterium]|nr:MAG: hypothetical protein EKK55_24475 [Rhodocyclaceae bacterium]